MGILGTVLGFGLAGNGWVLPVFCRTDEPEEPRDGESPILPLVKHLNKDLFPFLPTSASRICLLVPGGSQSPTLVQQHYHNFPVTILAFSRLQSKIFACWVTGVGTW